MDFGFVDELPEGHRRIVGVTVDNLCDPRPVGDGPIGVDDALIAILVPGFVLEAVALLAVGPLVGEGDDDLDPVLLSGGQGGVEPGPITDAARCRQSLEEPRSHHCLAGSDLIQSLVKVHHRPTGPVAVGVIDVEPCKTKHLAIDEQGATAPGDETTGRSRRRGSGRDLEMSPSHPEVVRRARRGKRWHDRQQT